MLKARRLPVLVGGVMLVVAGIAAQACGGGDDAGSDAEYVADVCGALTSFNDGLNELTATATNADPEKLANDFEDLLRDLGNALDDANPPDDVREAHDGMVDALDGAADAVEEGGIDALFDLELPEVQLDPEVRNRLQLEFNTSPECSGLDSIFS